MTVKVRRATEDDLPWIVDQVKDFMSFVDLSDDFFDPEYVPHLAVQCVNTGFVIIAEDVYSKERMGLLAAIKSPHLFNPKKTILTELCWWVPEKHRRSRAALALLATYIGWGKNNADIVTMSDMTNSPISNAALTKRGFVRRETSYVLEKK